MKTFSELRREIDEAIEARNNGPKLSLGLDQEEISVLENVGYQVYCTRGLPSDSAIRSLVIEGNIVKGGIGSFSYEMSDSERNVLENVLDRINGE